MTPIKITIHLSTDYYETIFREWLKNRSRNRKWQRLIGSILIVIGLLCALIIWQFRHNSHIAPVICIGFGIYQIVDFYRAKRQWIRERQESAVHDSVVQITFSPEGFYHVGPFAIGNYAWTGVQGVAETSTGLFLVLANGISIYLPKAAFYSTEDFEIVKSYVPRRQ